MIVYILLYVTMLCVSVYTVHASKPYTTGLISSIE